MSDTYRGGQSEYISYEYRELEVKRELASFYIDCYESFGWQLDNKFSMPQSGDKMVLKLKRDRKIANKTELTRLQRHFEADMEDIFSLENSKTSQAKMISLAVGLLGTAFMAGSVFAVTAEPPRIALCVILAVPAFAGWILPYFIYKKVKSDKTKKVDPYIREKYEEIYSICEKGHSLL